MSIALIVLSIIGIMTSISNEKEEKKKNAIKAQRKVEEEQRLASVFSERSRNYGQPTKTIHYSYKAADYDLQIYEASKIIFIEGKPYSFSDVLSCRIETSVVKGKETHITTPDKNQKYNMQALYGLDWEKHISKFNTEIVKEPDKTYYSVYIGLNNISNPQIKINAGKNAEIANEINAVLNIIIRQNQQ